MSPCRHTEIDIIKFFDEVLEIFKNVVRRLSHNCESVYANLLLLVSTLLLHASVKLSNYFVNQPGIINERIEKMWKQIDKSLRDDWIVSHYSPRFGGDFYLLKKAQDDLKVQCWTVVVVTPINFSFMNNIKLRVL